MTQPLARPRHRYRPRHLAPRWRMPRAARLLRAGTHLVLVGLAVLGTGSLVLLGLGPRTGLYRTLTVLSGSMQPGIPAGSVVIVTPQDPNKLKVGQVITYQIPIEDHRVITHRVVEVMVTGSQPVFQTKGDANTAVDPWTAQASGTMWRVRAGVPHMGHAIVALRNATVQRILVLGMPIILAITWLVDIWRSPAQPTRRRRHAAATT